MYNTGDYAVIYPDLICQHNTSDTVDNLLGLFPIQFSRNICTCESRYNILPFKNTSCPIYGRLVYPAIYVYIFVPC